MTSESLQNALGQSLQRRLCVSASQEYTLTWKLWGMQSGPPICAQRASARRTFDSGCIGWPTTTVNDATGSEYAYSRGNHDKPVLKLPGAAQLTGWPTPEKSDADGGRVSKEVGGTRPSGAKRSVTLGTVTANLTGWATCSARDWKDGKASQATMDRNSRPLNEQAVMLGPTPAPSSAETGSGGGYQALNPFFSGWLMGFPVTWGMAAQRIVSRSQRKSRTA